MHIVFDPNNDIQKFDSKTHDKHKVKTVIKKYTKYKDRGIKAYYYGKLSNHKRI